MKNQTLAAVLRGGLVRLGAILLVGATCISSFSWFAKNHELQQSNIQLGLQVDNAVAEYKVFKYNTKEAKGTDHVDAADGKIGTDLITIDSITLNQYDTIFKQRNRYTPAFIQIKLTQSGQTPPADGTINISITCKDSTETDPKADYCSQVLRFSAMLDQVKEGTKNSAVLADDTATYEAKDADTLYKAIDDKMYAIVNGYQCIVGNVNDHVDGADSFASQTFYKTISYSETDGYTLEKKDNCTVNLSLDYTKDDWAPAVDEEGNSVNVIFLYVYMTYDDGLIEIYKEENGLQIVSVGENVITFENNLKQIKVSFGK